MIEHGANIGFTAGNNLAMAHCYPGSDILLLNNDIVAEEPQWVERLQETAYSDPNIGIVGCRLRGDDGLVQHAGTFIFAETCWGSRSAGRKRISANIRLRGMCKGSSLPALT